MPRYIDADKAMDEINRIGGHNLCEWETIGVKALIDRQPTADVVEVVWCKDCKRFKMLGTTPRCTFYKGLATTVNPLTDYCSYGERRK